MAFTAALPPRTSLEQAVRQLGFVQYDPIQRPARAQDLILHQRVSGYRAGDLDHEYRTGSRGLNEGYLHVYGVMTPELSGLLHPRSVPPDQEYVPSGLAADVFAAVTELGPMHPRDVARRFESARVRNDWGGSSAATTRVLEELHYFGLIRVVRRDKDVKVYEHDVRPPQLIAPPERFRRLVFHLARSLAPIPEASLRSTITQLRRASGITGDASIAAELVDSGALERRIIADIAYLWPPELASGVPDEVPEEVRFLAPFDPLVWDRRRFAHLWGWPYRLEAYTPSAQRRFGYYALPMFLGERAIGWVNCELSNRRLSVDVRFKDQPLTGRTFHRALAREVDRLETMLRTQPSDRTQPPETRAGQSGEAPSSCRSTAE